MGFSESTELDELLEHPPSDTDLTLAHALAPEEIRRGDFVTLLDEIVELPSFFWCGDAVLLPCHEPVRIRLVSSGGGIPLRVKQVCLPFVLARLPCGQHRALDVRKCRLARLGKSYARVAWKAYKKSGAKTKRK